MLAKRTKQPSAVTCICARREIEITSREIAAEIATEIGVSFARCGRTRAWQPCGSGLGLGPGSSSAWLGVRVRGQGLTLLLSLTLATLAYPNTSTVRPCRRGLGRAAPRCTHAGGEEGWYPAEEEGGQPAPRGG